MTYAINPIRLTKQGLIKLALGLGVLLAPLYVWPSGGLQPGHLILALGIVVAFSKMRPVTMAESILALYLVYATIRESFEVIYSADIGGLLPALHIMFGYCIYVMTRKALELGRFSRALGWWLLVSTLFAVIGVLILGSGSLSVEAERAVGTFNNPNQLGYFGVLASSIALVLWLQGGMAQKWMLAVLVLCIYLCVLSLSKSAMGSVVMVLLSYFGLVAHRRTRWFIVGCILVLVALYFLADLGVLSGIYVSDFAAYNRIINAAQESDSSLAVRGYTILSDASWWQVLFGLSSEVVADMRGGYEVHSTYMAPIASYGLVGGGIFLAFIAMFNYRFIVRFGLIAYLGVVVPMMLYGIAHNGGRTPLFWVYMGIVAALSSRRFTEAPLARGGLETHRLAPS